MFKTAGLDEPATEKYVREMFAQYGLGGDQLVLVGSDPSMRAHLERYGHIDLALDCYPYHGTTTSCEAMWMGVPSIVLIGPTHVSRVGLSLLTNLGLSEFAAMSNDQFVEIAVSAAKDLDRLAEVRRTMRERMRSSPLMDVQGFCREIEDAYREMWRKWCASS
jgi:predicted O-linked N-acetylglucosamine transferase (SPINDLY family)